MGGCYSKESADPIAFKMNARFTNPATIVYQDPTQVARQVSDDCFGYPSHLVLESCLRNATSNRSKQAFTLWMMRYIRRVFP